MDENLCQRAGELGDHFITRLQEIESPYVALCRGKGLLIGIVLKPQAGGARRFCEALKEWGVLTKETHGNVMRLTPPLIVTREELDWALERIEDVLVEAIATTAAEYYEQVWEMAGDE